MCEHRPVTAARPSDVRSSRWGTASALLDDEEARRRLVAAAIRCVVRAGTGRINMEDVAAEAQVSRATLYRYFASREEVLLAVLASRTDQGLAFLVAKLKEPGNARRSIVDFMLMSGELVYGNEVNEALFSADSRSIVTTLELTAEPIVEGMQRHLCPLLQQWQDSGQLHPELDLDDTVRWMNTVAVILLIPPWFTRSASEKRSFLERYLVRALCTEPPAKRTARTRNAR